MTGRRLLHSTIAASALTLGLLCAVAGTAAASSGASERQQERQGAQIVSEVAAGKLGRAHLSRSRYELVGEYAMGRALGSTRAHEEADSLWEQMMGSGGAEAMHVYLGERYLGGGVATERRYGSLYGWMGAMMGGYGGPGLAERMSRYLRDHDGAAAGGGHDMGPGMMYGNDDGPYGAAGDAGGGWPTAAIVAVAVLGALLVGGALALALPRLRRGGRDSTAPTARP